MKLFNGGNNAALSYHVSTRYKIFSAPFQNVLGSSLFSYEYSIFFETSYFTKQLQTTDYKGFFVCLECQMIVAFVELRKGNWRSVIGEIL